jgi:hypothetical protein
VNLNVNALHLWIHLLLLIFFVLFYLYRVVFDYFVNNIMGQSVSSIDKAEAGPSLGAQDVADEVQQAKENIDANPNDTNVAVDDSTIQDKPETDIGSDAIAPTDTAASEANQDSEDGGQGQDQDQDQDQLLQESADSTAADNELGDDTDPSDSKSTDNADTEAKIEPAAVVVQPITDPEEIAANMAKVEEMLQSEKRQRRKSIQQADIAADAERARLEAEQKEEAERVAQEELAERAENARVADELVAKELERQKQEELDNKAAEQKEIEQRRNQARELVDVEQQRLAEEMRQAEEQNVEARRAGIDAANAMSLQALHEIDDEEREAEEESRRIRDENHKVALQLEEEAREEQIKMAAVRTAADEARQRDLALEVVLESEARAQLASQAAAGQSDVTQVYEAVDDAADADIIAYGAADATDADADVDADANAIEYPEEDDLIEDIDDLDVGGDIGGDEEYDADVTY